MVTQNKPFTCRSVTGCDVVVKTSPRIRFHWLRDHAQAEHPTDQAQWNSTRKGLAHWMGMWYKTQPEDRKHICEFAPDLCDYRTPMSAAGLCSHYVFKHTESPRAVAALKYAEANGLLELMDAGRYNREATVTQPSPVLGNLDPVLLGARGQLFFLAKKQRSTNVRITCSPKGQRRIL